MYESKYIIKYSLDIPLPNIEGRKQLLKLNLKNVKID